MEESLEWLPVVGKGFTAAYNPESRDIDVRDNANAIDVVGWSDQSARGYALLRRYWITL